MSNTDHDPPDTATPRNPFLVSASDSGGSADPFFQSPPIQWSPGQLVSGELIQAVRTIETKNTGGFTKLLVLFVSLGLFVAAGIAWWTPQMIAILVAVLLFHEAGHYLAMKAFGYRNVKMFFIPFLGAAVSGRHFNIAGWKKALVYLAGPLPGIIAALPLMWIGSAQQIDWMFELGGMSLFLNALNLLPIMPLDGGWIMHLTVFSRSPLLELLARMLGIVIMLAFAFFIGSRILFFFAIPLIISLPTTFRVSKLIRQMRDRPLPAPERDEIPEDAIKLLNQEMQSTALSEVATPQKAALIVQIYESLIVRPPGAVATLAIWLMYGGSFMAALVGGTTMFAMREFFWGGFFSDGMFDSTSQVVTLDVSDTQFFLGDEPIEASLLGVARFDSPGELNAKLKQMNPEDREQYTHVRIGNVLLATVPKKSDRPLNEFATASAQDDEDEFDAGAFRERMKAMFKPVDPKDTWLAPMVVSSPVTNQSHNPSPSTANGPVPGRPIVHVISGMHHDSIQLLCRAPNPQEAKRIVETDFQMVGVTADRLYLPTWSPIDPPTDQQLANRKVLQTLVNGITLESAPQLFEMRNKLYQAQYKDYDGESPDQDAMVASTRAATFQAKVRALEAKYTADLIDELSGEQAEVARQYQAFQSATHQHAKHIEERQIAREKKRQELGESFDDFDYEENENLYPTMDQFLDPENRFLGFGDSSQPHYAFAAHVSGEVMTADQYAHAIDPDAFDDETTQDEWEEGEWEDTNNEAMESESGEFVSLYLHRASDYTATVSAIIAHLQRQGFTDFSLHYVIPTSDFDK
ncbi:site-2 protease family protein [Neorhodopirellula pilleata]|uniref:Stage IV sporulation protein FB n=1 Tax=Neorhodopirellula pilleata TaxID=2714738 RepID=A0A5C6ASM1_9BACT|nr:site-2 protease family protein [Neorhodopirellula pilleata]TWU01982.1 Stage IV sporulation protein FB [Neorhodopirellula pilleata]